MSGRLNKVVVVMKFFSLTSVCFFLDGCGGCVVAVVVGLMMIVVG